MKSYPSVLGKDSADAAAMDQALRLDHLTQGEVVGYVELELALDGVLRKLVGQVPVPASAVRAYYRSHLSQFLAPRAYELRVIVVPTRTQAQAVLHALEADGGSNFGALAEAESIDTASAPEPGDLGWVTLSELSGVVARAVPRLKVEEYALASTPNGWAVLQLLAVRAPGRQSLSAATVAVAKTLAAQSLQSGVKAYLPELAKQARIQVLRHPGGASGAGTGGGGG